MIRSRKRQVLVIDRDRNSTAIISDACDRALLGQVTVVPDGIEGLRACFELKPDLVFLDVEAPRLPGEELLQMARASTTLASLPFIMMADTSRTQYREMDVYSMGADLFLPKPFTEAEVVAQIMSFFGFAKHDTTHPGARLDLRKSSGQFVAALLDDMLEKNDREQFVHRLTTNEIIPTKFQGFELISKLSEGNLGVTYRARQLSLDREIALKILLKRRPEARLVANRFRAEVQTMAQLSHRNLVHIIDAGETPQLCYFAMDFIVGETLDKMYLKGDVMLNPVLIIASQICNALDYLHGQGIIHQQLKSKHIFITEDGTVKVGGFGLTLNDWQLTEEGQRQKDETGFDPFVFTAPEVRHGERASRRSDVFSIARILQKTLAPNAKNFSKAVLQRMRPDVPLVVWNVLERATSIAPSERYKNSIELKNYLNQAATSAHIT